jgi:hypothetical protein
MCKAQYRIDMGFLTFYVMMRFSSHAKPVLPTLSLTLRVRFFPFRSIKRSFFQQHKSIFLIFNFKKAGTLSPALVRRIQ